MTTRGRRRADPDAETVVVSAQNAREELAGIVRESSPFRQLREELEQYPLSLFRRVCTLNVERGGPVPDYTLGLVPYLGDVSLRALEQAQLIEKVERRSPGVHAYEPTAKGKALWQRLQAEVAAAATSSS